METEGITEVINMQSTSDFLSGKELVDLRKPEELAPQLNMGPKFSECKNTEAEKEAINCALDSQKTILSQKRGTRICDLMQAEWNEMLNVSFATKLKGKFVQHMGVRVDDKIVLTPEESLFLLENGCLEIMNGKAPMSTEEAYAAMLKNRLSVEKYIVYSYLSQLGFIVIPHQKEIKSKLPNKAVAAERNKKKRKNESPLLEDSRKRLTFSGAFSQEADSDKDSKITEESKSLLNDIAVISRDPSSSAHTECQLLDESGRVDVENELPSVSPHSNNLENSKTDIDKEDQLQSCHSEVILSSPQNNLEKSKVGEVEIESDVEESNSVKPSLSASVASVDVDSQSTDVLMDSLVKSTGVFVAETEGANTEATTHSSDSPCDLINDTSDVDEQNSVLSVSSCDYNDLESRDENSGEANLIVDDDITLVEITKKETTPLAVIDLLSDDEEPMDFEETGAQDDSESDDDIKILEVCNGSTNSSRNKNIPLNLSKIKSQKIENYKNDQSHATLTTTPRIQFPELFRKELVCIARPLSNLLPLHVQPGKEVYILDCSKLQQTNRGSYQSSTTSQPPGRLWNSYRDMQDYQRSLRRNRQFNRHQNQDRPWQRGPRYPGEMPYRRLPPYHNNNLSSSRERNDHISPLNRHSDVDYREHSTSRNRHNSDYRNQNGSEDQKPFMSSRTPALLSDNSGDSVPPRIPHFSNPNSLWVRHPAPNFPSGNPLDLNNPPGGVHGLTSQEFVAEVHRTAYSYAQTMLSSMFGPAFNPNNFSSLAPRPPFGMPQPITLMDGQNSRNLSSPFANEYYPLPNSRQLHGDFSRNRRYHRTEPFPCHYRNIQNKKSWNDVRVAVSRDQGKSDSESSDIEEIPINVNEFLWNASNICPLVKPGIKHPLVDVLNPLKLTQLAKLTDKTCKNERYFTDNQILEINFDVFKPGTPFKKSCPGTPTLRIIVMRASDPVPRYSEIAFLQRKWDDGASLQIALVDNGDISFYSFSSICIPEMVPFQD